MQGSKNKNQDAKKEAKEETPAAKIEKEQAGFFFFFGASCFLFCLFFPFGVGNECC